jgi:hypothetical protein
MFRRFILLFAIILTASTALADQRILGHMTPLPNEFLADPVTLDCGITVQEARGITLDYPRLNSLCTHAYANFFKFIDAKGLKTSHRASFKWNASFLPEKPCYRCLNDEAYRFKYRHVHGNLIGYTDKDVGYAFMSSVRDAQFNTTFVHELFHSMSMYYGVYDNHPGNWAAKTAADEVLAQDFTEWLGYGR